MLFGVDLVGELLVSLICLVVIITITQQLEEFDSWGSPRSTPLSIGVLLAGWAPNDYFWTVCLTDSALSCALALSSSACC